MRRLLDRSLLAALSLAVLAVGCPSREVSEVLPNQSPEEYKDIPVDVNRDIDIVFLIDNSNSMSEEQTSLTNNFGRFVNVLENIEGGLPNVHIGIVSSNVGAGGQPIQSCAGDGDNGRFQNAPRIAGCTPPSGYFISDVDDGAGGRTKNYTGTLADTFSCIAKLGTNGCGFEQHLEGIRRALDGRNAENAGFLRDSAFLAVIIIADEDDCSAKDSALFDPNQTMDSDPLGPLVSYRCTEFGIECNGDPIGRTPRQLDPPGGGSQCTPIGAMSSGDTDYLWHPQVYADFLKGLKADPNLILVAGIIGNIDPVAVGLDMMGHAEIEPSCQTTAGKAAPAIRQRYFLDQFPNRNTATSICAEDLSDALLQVSQLLARVIGNPCLEGDVDTTDLDPGSPGQQIACQVSDVQYPDSNQEVDTPLPRCVMDNDTSVNSGSPRPCWYAYQDPAQCASFISKLVLVVDRGGGDPAPGTHVIARCKVNQ